MKTVGWYLLTSLIVTGVLMYVENKYGFEKMVLAGFVLVVIGLKDLKK